jgi:tetratricopeptide (TPR) repeat protein
MAVRASFDVSLQAMDQSSDPVDQSAAATFGLLSLPDGPDLGLAAAARLIDQPEHTARRLLERLVDAQLLETPSPDRYQFHDLVRLSARQHAQSRHPEPQRLAALIRMFGFYTATAWHTLAHIRPGDPRAATADPRWINDGRPFPDASAALGWLEAERANLLTAIPQAAAALPAIPAELACQLTQTLFGFFVVRGYWQDGVHANQIALELARRTQNLAAQAHAQSDLGILHWLLDRYAESIAFQQDSLTIFRKLGDRRGEALCLNNLGIVYRRLGRYEEAILCHHDSLTIFRKLGDRRGEALSLNNLGNVYRRLGRHEEAILCHHDSLTIFRELGDRHGEALNLDNLGNVYRRLERHEEAIACEQDSLTIFRELGDRHGQAEAMRDLGDALRAVGHDCQAGVVWQEALAMYGALQVPEADKIRDRLAILPSEVAEPPGTE